MDNKEGSDMKFDIRAVIELLFLPVATAAVFVLWDLNKSVNLLNVQVAVLISSNNELKDSNKEVRGELLILKQRVDRLEATQKGKGQ